jgi:hypothetical protein
VSPEEDSQLSRRARMVALVVAGTMVIWLGAPFIGKQLDLPGRYMLLFDLAALAAFFWAIVVAIQIWRRRRED